MQTEKAVQLRDSEGRLIPNGDVLQRGIQALKDQHQATTDSLERWTIERGIEGLERRLSAGPQKEEKRDSSAPSIKSSDRPDLPEDSADPQALKLLMGYAARYGVESKDLGGFVEVIKEGAFNGPLSSADDALALVNHDANLILGRRSSKTLVIGSDSRGLKFQVRPGKSRLWDDVTDMVQRRDLSECSFAFIVGRDEWKARPNALPLRIIHEVARLSDVSVVSNPAYSGTNAEMVIARFSIRSVDARVDMLAREVDLLKLKAPRITR